MNRFVVTTARAYNVLRHQMQVSPPRETANGRMCLWKKIDGQCFETEEIEFIKRFDDDVVLMDDDEARDWLFKNSPELNFEGGNNA